MTDEKWQLTITRADNGYILITPDTEEQSGILNVIEIPDDDELAGHERLLWEVMNYFNFGGSKHDKERIRVKRERQF